MDLKKQAEFVDYAKGFEGVRVRGKTIAIDFYYRGARCRESLKGLELTKNNIKFASNKRNAVLYDIEKRVFDYANHFPNSKKANIYSKPKIKKTIGDALRTWLKIKKGKIAPSSYKSYNSKSLVHIFPKWEFTFLDELTKSDIEEWIQVELNTLTNKTINNVLIPLRGVFTTAHADGFINKDPLQFINNLTVVYEEPDPFTRDEIAKIISTETDRQSELNAFEFACWTGLSVSELIALAWEDIDLRNWTFKVNRGNVDGQYKMPKVTSRERIVELLDPAIAVLKRQKELSFMLKPTNIEVLQRDNKKLRKESLRMVFVKKNFQPAGGVSPFANDQQYRDRFFKNHIRKVGVRYRGPNHARHTYASQLLTAGVPKEWIALQMGHTSTKMIDQHYGKWITEETPRMAAFVSTLLAENNSDGHRGVTKNTTQLGEPSKYMG